MCAILSHEVSDLLPKCFEIQPLSTVTYPTYCVPLFNFAPNGQTYLVFKKNLFKNDLFFCRKIISLDLLLLYLDTFRDPSADRLLGLFITHHDTFLPQLAVLLNYNDLLRFRFRFRLWKMVPVTKILLEY